MTKKTGGILVWGDDDFSKTPEGCYTIGRVRAGGRGEDASRVLEPAVSIPPLAGEAGTVRPSGRRFKKPERTGAFGP